MKTSHRALISVCVALAGLASGCAGLDVSTEHDPAVDFGRGFHSYAWLPDAEMKDTGVSDALTDKMLREAIDAEMAAKGFTRVADAPDFLLAYRVGIENKNSTPSPSSAGFVSGAGGYRGASFGVSSGEEVFAYDEGTLVLDFLRGAERKPVWRGAVSKAVDKSASRDVRVTNARTAVARLLEEFPPKKGS